MYGFQLGFVKYKDIPSPEQPSIEVPMVQRLIVAQDSEVSRTIKTRSIKMLAKPNRSSINSYSSREEQSNKILTTQLSVEAAQQLLTNKDISSRFQHFERLTKS